MSTQVAAMVTSEESAHRDQSSLVSEDISSKHVCSQYLKKRPPDPYGQRHAIETTDLIQDSLILLENEIWNLPEEDQSILIRVSVECSEIFESKDHRLMFLRCEQFNVDMAAIRLCKYWKKRTELFGDAAFHPLTLANCREIDEENEFSMGFLNLLPLQDDTGRSMIYIDPSVVEGQQYNCESMVRAAWYTLHAALENDTTQQKGIVFLVNLGTTLPRHFDRRFTQLLASSIRGVLPVRVSAIHIFNAPYLFEILFDAVAALLGDRLTKRIKLYSDENVNQIGEYGIGLNMLPVDLGGDINLDPDRWLADRARDGK